MNVLLNRIDAARIIDIQKHQYSEALYGSDTIPALSQSLGSVAISNLGHFWLKWITLSFTTIEGAVAADTGIDYLRGQLRDGQGNKPLFNDYIPFGLFATPGRRKSLAASGSDSFQMQIIFPYEHFFEVNSSILLDVKNDATLQPNAYSVVYWGVRILV